MHTDTAPSHPYFSIIKDRLYRVCRDTQTGEVVTQLVVPKSRREMIFQAAHYNPMAGHLGCEKTQNQIMDRFFWPGIWADVRRWCAPCPECQLVNTPAIPKMPLRPLPLVEIPFDRVAMDLISPFDRSTQGYRAGFNIKYNIRTCYLWNRRKSVEFLFTPGLLRSKHQSTEV